MTRAAHRAGAALRRRARLAHSEKDRGYSILEVAITLPAMIVLTMIIVQFAIVWQARDVAQAAAQEGLRTAEAYRSSAAAGRSDAQNFLHQTASHLLPNATITVVRTATTVTVRVRATVPRVLPFGSYTVDSTVSGPIEQFQVSP